MIYDSTESELYLHLTEKGLANRYELNNLLKHVFMPLYGVNWKNRNLSDCQIIAVIFFSFFFSFSLDWHWFPIWNLFDIQRNAALSMLYSAHAPEMCHIDEK